MKFPRLQEVSLSDCGLTGLPQSLSALKTLRGLNLVNNPFASLQDVVEALQTLPSLQELHLSLLQKSEVALVLASLPGLAVLNGQGTVTS